MSDFTLLERGLEQLGRELGSGTQHADSIVQRAVMRASDGNCTVSPQKRRLSPWHASAAAAASLAVCLGIWWVSRPATLYARMIMALADANTVHATGWTRHILRKWPLEQPPEEPTADGGDQKFPLEIWYWTDADGTPRAYERQGSVTLVRRGGDFEEYQPDVDLKYVYEGGYRKDKVAEFGRLAEYLTALQRPSLRKEELGRRLENGRWVRGIRHVEGNRIDEIWIDEAASLPVRISRRNRESGAPIMELTFSVNAPVPKEVSEFEPPETKTVRYGRGNKVNDVWRQHVAEIGERLQTEPIDGSIALLPRTDGRRFAFQHTMATPDGKYWVRPLDNDQYFPMTLAGFVTRLVATEEGDRRYGTWRLAKEFRDIELPRSDLVHEANVPWQEWVQFVLSSLGFEFVDTVENRTVWIAKHDGRDLKPWQEVKPPVPYIVEGGVEKKGLVRPGVGHRLVPATMKQLFADFNRLLGDLDADKPWIIDQTGLPQPPPYDSEQHGTPREYSENVLPAYYVATDSPWFAGQESIDMAREWYAKEFGITFTEETRMVTVHVIRRKQ
ncbi:MAG TPA: hypothetical protein VGK58_12105 [Lacipirellulaceae bacterium]